MDLTIYQSNPLVQSRKHYGIMEHRLFRLAISDLRPKLKNSVFFDEEFRPFHMDTKEIVELFQCEGIERDGMYTRLRNSCKNMFESNFEIQNGNDFELCHVFDKIKFSTKDGLDIQFHRDMKKLLLDMEHGNYTRTLLKLSFSLSSTYSLILLELMLQYQGIQKSGRIDRKLTMEEIRFSMDVPEDAYKGRIDNFRRFVVDAAIKEINEKTDYYMEPEYELIRGPYNKVTGFHFVLYLPEEKEKEPPSPVIGLEERLKGYGVHRDAAERLAKMPHAEENLKIALKEIGRGKAKNPAAYIKSAIEQDWKDQRDAMRRAEEAERRERMEKRGVKWKPVDSDFADEDSCTPEQLLKRVEEIADSDSLMAAPARRLLERRKKEAMEAGNA